VFVNDLVDVIVIHVFFLMRPNQNRP